jgi:hypothetical protein
MKQAQYFEGRDTEKMNTWILENNIDVIDIKVTATQFTVHYLVIYTEL